MAYTALELINRSWYLSGIVARSFQSVTGDKVQDGLYLLNALLDWKSIQTDLIPYYTYVSMPLVAGQEFYFLPNVGEVELATFDLNNVRYPMESMQRGRYFGSSRVNNITTLPFNWNFNRGEGGGTIGFYFIPDSTYTLKMMVKLFLNDISLNTDLTNISSTLPYTFLQTQNAGYDRAYIEYLRYELANYMCNEYNFVFNMGSMQTLKSMRRTLMYVEPPDLSMNKISILTQGSPLNFGDVNIGHGWRP